jgi:hypothetical protein
MFSRGVEPLEGSVSEPWTQRVRKQALGEVESLVQCLLPDAPESGRWAGLGRPPVGRGTGSIVLAGPRKRRNGAAIATADVRQGDDLEKEPTGIELLQGVAGVAGSEKACLQELIALTPEWETRGTLIQPDPKSTCHSVSSIQYQSYTPGYTTASLSETHKINRAPTKNNDSVTPQRRSNDYNCRLS